MPSNLQYFVLKNLPKRRDTQLKKLILRLNIRNSNLSFRDIAERIAFDLVMDLFQNCKDVKLKDISLTLYEATVESLSSFGKSISSCSLLQLTSLRISHTQMSNIQFISHINCPQLNCLSLTGNKISKVNALVKFNSKKLRFLYLDDNLIVNLDKDLARMNLTNVVRMELNGNLNTDQSELFKVGVTQLQDITLKVSLKTIPKEKVKLKNNLIKKFGKKVKIDLSRT